MNSWAPAERAELLDRIHDAAPSLARAPVNVLHHDDGIYPLPRPHDQVVVTCMWPFDDFTSENGATRLVPGSHTGVEGRPDDGQVVVAEMPAIPMPPTF